MEREKHVDESWKESVEKEKDPAQPSVESPVTEDLKDAPEVSFINYLPSLAFQTMIFLGEIPNPFTEKVEKNLPQAKFLIDTLGMIREKTKGNLSQPESDFLNGSLYELQMKYVEHFQKEAK